MKVLFLIFIVFLILSGATVLWFQRQKTDIPNIARQETSVGSISYELNKESSITLLFTGDVIPARSVNSKMVRMNNFFYPFEKTADFLKEADLTVINLESPLAAHCPVTDSGMVFCGNMRFAKALANAGVDIANLANNHSSNYGAYGMQSTKEVLLQNGISTVGEGNILYQNIKGVNIAFLSYNGVAPFFPEPSLL